MPDLSEQLRSLIEDAAAPLSLDELHRMRRHRRPRTRGLVAAVVIVAIAVSGVVIARAVGRDRTHVAVTAGTRRSGWAQLPSSPLSARAGQVMAWTGSELLVWGGAGRSGMLADGAIYDPAARRWRSMSASPLRPTSGLLLGVWDGTQLLVWDAHAGSTAGAAYNPSSNRWREIAALPRLDNVSRPLLVWTGKQAVLWWAAPPTGSAEPVKTAMALYDPRTDRWRSVDPGPLDINEVQGVWDGAELIITGWVDNAPNGVFPTGGHHLAAAYNPETETWRSLPAPPGLPEPYGSALSLSWNGHEAIVYGYELHAASYDPPSDTWQSLPDVPLRGSECYPASAAIRSVTFAYYCGAAAIYDRRTRQWTTVRTPFEPGGPATPSIMYPPNIPLVATSTEFLVIGDGPRPSSRANITAWSYTPPEP